MIKFLRSDIIIIKKIVGENYFYKKFNPLSKIYSPPFFFLFFSLSPRLSHLFFKFEYPVSPQFMSTLSTSTRMQTSDLTNRLGAEIEQVPFSIGPDQVRAVRIRGLLSRSMKPEGLPRSLPAYIGDYSRLRGRKITLDSCYTFAGPPPLSSPLLGTLGAKIFYNNNNRRNSKNVIHGIFHIPYDTIPGRIILRRKCCGKGDYHSNNFV